MFFFNFIFLTTLFLFSTLMVLFTTNPVYCVFFLIFSFTIVASFFFFLGIDLLGVFLIILYVGAIAVLFLFVLMMLNVKTFEYYSSRLDYAYISLCLISYIILETFYLYKLNLPLYGGTSVSLVDYQTFSIKLNHSYSLINFFGEVFFTYFVLYFILVGLILLLTMVGAIVLTLHHKLNVRRQSTYVQVNREASSTISLR